MRLTVGPLPSAVYWRRRAIVLGVAVVLVFLIVQSCSGGEGKSNGGGVPASADAGPRYDADRGHQAPAERGAPVPRAGAGGADLSARRVHDADRPPAGERRLHRRRGVGDPGAGAHERPAWADDRHQAADQEHLAPARAAATSAPTCRSSTSSAAPRRCGRRTPARAPRAPTCSSCCQHRARVPGRLERRDITRCANNVANGPVPRGRRLPGLRPAGHEDQRPGQAHADLIAPRYSAVRRDEARPPPGRRCRSSSSASNRASVPANIAWFIGLYMTSPANW